MRILILIPIRDIHTEEETLARWNAGKDFLIRTIGVRGTYASIRDMANIKDDFDQVYIRYNDGLSTVTVYSKER